MYSEKITTAHTAWEKAENAIPEQEYNKGFKNRTATARKLWSVFANACEAEQLQPVTVAHDLSGVGKPINLSKR